MLLEIKTKLIKFCTKVEVKQAKFCRLKAKLPAFFEKF